MAKTNRRNGMKGKTGNGEKKSSLQQLSAGGSVPPHTAPNKVKRPGPSRIKKDKKQSSSRFTMNKNRKLQKLLALKGTPGMKMYGEGASENADSQTKNVKGGVVTRSQSKKQIPQPACSKRVVVKRKRSRKERTKQAEEENGDQLLLEQKHGENEVVDNIPSPPPTYAIIPLEAAACVLHTCNNPFYRGGNRIIDEGPRRVIEPDPEMKRWMEILNFPTDCDVDWLLSAGMPNEEQKMFLLNLSQAVMEVFKLEETHEFLKGIFHNRVESVRHANFMGRKLAYQRDYMVISGAGPFDTNEAHNLVRKLDAILLKVATKKQIMGLGAIDAYLLNVWLPDFIIFAVQKVMLCSYAKAEEIFLTTSSFL